MKKRKNYQILKIGKSPSNNVFKIFNNDPTVSNIHCEIFIDEKGFNILFTLNTPSIATLVL